MKKLMSSRIGAVAAVAAVAVLVVTGACARSGRRAPPTRREEVVSSTWSPTPDTG